MTKKELFDNRAKELGVYGKFNDEGIAFAEVDDGYIFLTNLGDYLLREYKFPFLEDLKFNRKFRDKFLRQVIFQFADEDIVDTAKWLFGDDDCPFRPEDLIWMDDLAECCTHCKQFNDEK